MIYQPVTTDITIEGFKVARNSMRLKLWNDDIFAHKWLCHPNNDCKDGCDIKPIESRFNLYESEVEV
jgi:hypothetical protein